tara:strand:- start:2309 stop:3244 length:936 start_codon:yes stop_codon:yes gene_type:complete
MLNKLGYVLGCNGYVGQALVNELISQGVKVIGIGRSPNSKYRAPRDSLKGGFTYVSLHKKKINCLKDVLPNISETNFTRSVFFNLAWSGKSSISDGSIEDQFKNITLSTEAIKVASQIGCDAFIHIGSTQEGYLTNYLNETWKSNEKTFKNQLNYSLAKSTCKDFNKLTSYLEKIDYIHCTFSVFINKDISGKGFIHSTLRSIDQGQKINSITTDQYFDITSLEEGCKAIYLIGYKCISKKKFFYIGASCPFLLKDIFKIFNSFRSGNRINIERTSPNNIIDIFNNKDLLKETGYAPSQTFLDFSKKYFNS